MPAIALLCHTFEVLAMPRFFITAALRRRSASIYDIIDDAARR